MRDARQWEQFAVMFLNGKYHVLQADDETHARQRCAEEHPDWPIESVKKVD